MPENRFHARTIKKTWNSHYFGEKDINYLNIFSKGSMYTIFWDPKEATPWGIGGDGGEGQESLLKGNRWGISSSWLEGAEAKHVLTLRDLFLELELESRLDPQSPILIESGQLVRINFTLWTQNWQNLFQPKVIHFYHAVKDIHIGLTTS